MTFGQNILLLEQPTIISLFVSHVLERNPVERINFEFFKTFRYVMIKLKGLLENDFLQCFPGVAGTVEYMYGVSDSPHHTHTHTHTHSLVMSYLH